MQRFFNSRQSNRELGGSLATKHSIVGTPPNPAHPIGEVSAVANYKCYKLHIYISELWKYLAGHAAVTVGIILYYVFIAKYMPTALWVLTIVLHILVTGVQVAFAFVDPGIVKKNLPGFQYSEYSNIPVSQQFLTGEARYTDKIHLFAVKGYNVKLKYCRQCLNYRAPRTVHCGACNACIDRFDHHCPWLGNCVGKHNYRVFFLFLVSVAILDVLVLTQSIICIAKYRANSQVTGVSLGFSIVMLLYSVLGGIFTGVLLIMHTYYVSTNTTTYEYMKKNWKSKAGNPYKKRICLKNCIKIFGDHLPEKVKPDELIEQRRIQQRPVFRNINLSQQSLPPAYTASPLPSSHHRFILPTYPPTGPPLVRL